METILYLVRHAQSRPKASQHHSEWRLSPTGVRQSEQLAELLQSLGIRRIFSSPYVRCLQTVAPFARKSGIRIAEIDGLRERLVAVGLIDNFDEIWARSWVDFDFALPGCETSAEAQIRFTAAVESILDETDQSPIALSTHGNVIGLFLNRIDNSVARKETEQLRNPDVLKITRRNSRLAWDRDFRLPGLDAVATDYRETPFERNP